MYEKPIAYKNGLIDPNSLLEFMDGCHCKDLVRPNGQENHVLEFHHLYFPRRDYQNLWAPLPIRRLRNARTNLVEMLPCQEDYYHESSHTAVEHDQIDLDAAETFIQEDEWLTQYASSSWITAELQSQLERPKTLTKSARARAAAQLALMNEMRAGDLIRVNSIELIADKVVTGALARYSSQQPESTLDLTVQSRLAKDPVFIPIKNYGHRMLKETAEIRLAKKINTEPNWAVRRLLTQAA